MKKHSKYFILSLLLILVACNRKQLSGFETDVLVPLASASIGFDKLIADSTAKVNADKSIDIVYRYPFYDYAIKDILSIPDTSVTVSAKLGTANLSNNFLEQKITLGRIAQGLGTTGQLITLLHGQTAVIPAIPANTSNQVTDIDANTFFQEADLTNGFLDLSIYNDLPIPVSDLDFNVKNKIGGQLVFSDTFSLIPAGATVTRTYNLTGKHIEGFMVGNIVKIGSPGSYGSPVLIDTSKAIIMQLKVRNLTANHAIARFPKQDLIVVDDSVIYELGKAKIRRMLIRSGKVRMNMYSTLQDTLYIDYKIPGTTKNNDTVHMFLKVPPAKTGGVQNVSQEVDLQGFTIDLQGKSGKAYNSFWNIFRASIDSSGRLIALSTSDSVWIKYGLYDIVPQFAEGYLGQDIMDIGPTKTTIEAFTKIIGGTLDLKDINVSVNVENGIGADASLDFDYLTSKNTKSGTTIALNSPLISSPFVISRAIRSGFTSKSVNSALNFTITNSNIKAFAENLPDEMNYKFTAKLNPNGNQAFSDFINYDSKLSASLDVKMPLAFKASQLMLCDTIPFSLGNTQNDNTIDNGILNFIFENNYPITLQVKLFFLNSQGQVVDSVFEGNGATVIAGPLDPVTLRTTGAGKSILKVAIDAARFDRLIQSSKIVLKAVMNTSGSSPIKLYSDYKLNLKLTGEFKYHAGKR